MKLILSSLLALALLATGGYAQMADIHAALGKVELGSGVEPVTLNTNTSPPTLSGPAVDAFQFLTTTSSNWFLVPYFTLAPSLPPSQQAGGGLAIGYEVTPVLCPVMRMDYLASRFWEPSLNVQLQAPITIAGKLTAIPFAVGGIAVPISGAGSDNGTAQGILGAGLAIKIAKRLDFVYDCEKWSAIDGLSHRFGLLWKPFGDF